MSTVIRLLQDIDGLEVALVGGKPNAEDLIQAARTTTMIQIRLEEI